MVGKVLRIHFVTVLAVAVSAVRSTAEPEGIAFPKALDASVISLDRLDDILDRSFILGNGDLNGLLYEEAGSLILRISKNDVWDARLDTANDPPLPTLKRLNELAYGKWSDRKWILPKGYELKGKDSYHEYPYPTPRACAVVRIGADPNSFSRQRMNSNGTPSAQLDIRRAVAHISESSSQWKSVAVRALAQQNVFLIEAASPVHLTADKPSYELPVPTMGKNNCIEWLCQDIPGDLDWPGMSFAVALAANGTTKAVAVVTSREAEDVVDAAVKLAEATIKSNVNDLVHDHEDQWQNFWSQSGVDLADQLLCRTWYRNLYFLRCITKPSVIAPGLFAGLIDDRPAWHGDYHTNYNLQQTFWSCYNTNHPELAEPYDRLISDYLPRARWLARKVFDCGGAYYPHVLFAYEPANPDKCRSRNGRQYFHHVWAMTIGVSGFTVQPLWWHYKYRPDREYLKIVAYPAIRDVAVFYTDFLDQCQLDKDSKVVLAPSVSPEHWGWTAKFERNRNCTFDIAMIRYTLEAAIEAALTLDCDKSLIERFQKSLSVLPDYPLSDGSPPVVVDVQDAPPTEYNIAVPATPVFPGDIVTWQSPADEEQLFVRTLKNIGWNGNNSTIILGVGRARLSIPDTRQWLREEVEHRLRPNGTLSLNRRGHRFNSFGHYTEQFAVSMAVSELLLQSVGDVIRVFPAWPLDQNASFRQLRGQGGFLVSARCRDGKIEPIVISSTVGGKLRLLSPCPKIKVSRAGDACDVVQPDAYGIVELNTKRGEELVFSCVQDGNAK